jgi:uncharacterized surface protein with fasciclin (FAS1) repeats
VPRAFSSVTGPVYLRPGYSIFMYAMQKSKVLGAVTKENAEYSFFPIPDHILMSDSSLMLTWIDKDLNRNFFNAFNRSEGRMNGMPSDLLAKRILNQVGTSLPNQSANKEFIETLGGNFLIWNNADNTVQGSRPNSFGYKGDSAIFYNPVLLEEPADNGQTWMVESWFSHSTTDLYGVCYSKFRTFMNLLAQAGLYDEKLYDFPFLIKGESYTIFVPSEEALNKYRADTLAKEELSDFLLYHFVRGHRIFTDNKKPWMEYETLRKDESSSQFVTYFSELNIRPGPDVIDILGENGDIHVSIPDTPGRTNVMVAYDKDKVSTDDTDFIITTVIHEIDTVLIKP